MEEIETNETGLSIEHAVDGAGDPMLVLNGELDISTADAFREAVARVVEGKPARLVFELSQLTFMDSSGIAVMVYAANNVGVIELRHASTIIRRVVEATGLAEILPLDAS
jgi:anti-sigma B factor antagonist